AKLVARRLNVAVPTVYKRAQGAGLKAVTKDLTPRPGDLRIVRWYGPERNGHDLADYLGMSKNNARYHLMTSVKRVWRGRLEPQFPEPQTPTEVQVYNVMRQLVGQRDEYDVPLIEDVEYIANQGGFTLNQAEPYHLRYIEHAIRLETHGAKAKRTGRRAKRRL